MYPQTKSNTAHCVGRWWNKLCLFLASLMQMSCQLERELRAAAPIVVFRGEFVRVSWWITNDCRYCEKYSLSRHFVTCPSTDHSHYSPDRSLLYYRRHTPPYLSLWHFSCNWIIHLQHPVVIKNTAENIFQHSFIKSTNRKEGRKSKEIYF